MGTHAKSACCAALIALTALAAQAQEQVLIVTPRATWTDRGAAGRGKVAMINNALARMGGVTAAKVTRDEPEIWTDDRGTEYSVQALHVYHLGRDGAVTKSRTDALAADVKDEAVKIILTRDPTAELNKMGLRATSPKL